jgi:glycine cleavage system regulatory protein
MASLTLTVIGRDRPGIVGVLSERIANAGGNWLESRMAHLADRFAGMLLVEVPDANVERLVEALRDLETEGLQVTVEPAAVDEPPADWQLFTLDLVGQDRPGIVREITGALAERRVNIEELTTGVSSGSFSAESMFRAEARLRVPQEVSLESLRDALEAIGNELMVDITLDRPPEG